MSKTLKVKIITLNNIIKEENIIKIFIKSKDGGMQIMPGHAPMITSIVPNITVLQNTDGDEIKLFTSKGVFTVENNEVTFCCDAAEFKDDIDLKRAERAKKRAEDRIKDSSNNDVNRAKSALERASLRIQFKEE